MEEKDQMTREEIHDFGVQIVCEAMAEGGYEIIGSNPSLAVTPQIVARKKGRLCFVVVRTDIYPNKGKLTDREIHHNLQHAERNDATSYFASVGICNATATDDSDEERVRIPARGAGFYVDFDGLKVMTTIDRLGIANGNAHPLP